MKKFNLSFDGVLLATTILFSPAIAAAQEAQAPEEPPAAEDAIDADEIVVLGRFIPEPMRQTSEVATFLSSEDLARTGDDNAALALTRLTGVSVVGGRFVYIRGLGDRYSSALLNGSPLPSPEPLRRQVPLDLFPSNILDGAVVQKTFSPNYPGEFGGGIIDMRTVRQPGETFFTFKLGSGWNTETTLQKGVVHRGSDTDWAGFDDGLRDIPGPLEAALARKQPIRPGGAFSNAELEVIGESLVNSPLTVIQTEDQPFDFEGEFTGGTSIDFGRYNLGLVGVVGFDQSWRTRRADRANASGTGASIAINKNLDVVTTFGDTVANMFGSASIGRESSEVTLTGLLIRSTTKYTEIAEGFDQNISGALDVNTNNLRTEASAWYERQLASVQIAGEHEFGALKIDWRGAVAESTRDAPYERELSYTLVNIRQPDGTFVPTPTIGGTGGQFNRIRFSELTDQVTSAGMDVGYTIPLSEQRDLELSAGWAYSNTTRDFDFLQLGFGAVGAVPLDVLQARVDFAFSPDNIDPNRWVITENSLPDDSYKGRLTNLAYYAAADAELLPRLRAAVGVRYEDAAQTVRTGNRLGAGFTPAVNLDNTYWLPTATLTWNFAEDLQLRVGYSQTISRPQLREVARSAFIDPDTDRLYRGNPLLTDTEFQNYDARLEYYFGRNQFVTVGGFYKDITNPIEEVYSGAPDDFTSFINAPDATVYGAEIEFKTTFEMPFSVPLIKDAEWLFAVNYTYTKSEVSGGIGVANPFTDAFTRTTTDEFDLEGSQLQGTPEHVVNMQFGYETDSDQLTLLVGWVDERISRRGITVTPATFEVPGVNVDLVYRHDFVIGGQAMTLGLSGRNLANTEFREYQGFEARDLDVERYERGRNFSLSLTAKF